MNEKQLTKIGVVMSDKMSKTVVVRVETLKQHTLYKKTIRHHAKFKAHDEKNSCHTGDIVKIVQARPLSKTKRWTVAEVVRHGQLLKEITLGDEPEPIKDEKDDTASDTTESGG